MDIFYELFGGSADGRGCGDAWGRGIVAGKMILLCRREWMPRTGSRMAGSRLDIGTKCHKYHL